MRVVLIAVAVAAALWSGYWYIGSRSVENGLRGWLNARADAGWTAGYSDVQTRGFPNRFDTTITDLDLAEPATGVAWSAPFLQLFQLSYQPDHIIAVWPGTQTITAPRQRLTIGSDRFQASAIFKPDSDLELDHSNVVLDGLVLTSTAGWSAQVDSLLFATRRTAARPQSHDIGVEATAIRLPDTLSDRLDPAGLLPRTVDRLKIDAAIGLDAPLDRTAIETARPAITRIDLNLLQANWGQLELWATGDLQIDASGLPTGTVTIKAQNWREMLRIGVATGWIPEALQSTLEAGLEPLASLSGSSQTLDAPLTFADGKVALGPIPLGPAPRLRPR